MSEFKPCPQKAERDAFRATYGWLKKVFTYVNESAQHTLKCASMMLDIKKGADKPSKNATELEAHYEQAASNSYRSNRSRNPLSVR